MLDCCVFRMKHKAPVTGRWRWCRYHPKVDLDDVRSVAPLHAHCSLANSLHVMGQHTYMCASHTSDSHCCLSMDWHDTLHQKCCDTISRKFAQEFGEPYDLEVRCRCDPMGRKHAHHFIAGVHLAISARLWFR